MKNSHTFPRNLTERFRWTVDHVCYFRTVLKTEAEFRWTVDHVCYFRTVLKTEAQFRWDKEKRRGKKDTRKLSGVKQNSHFSRKKKG